MKFHQADTDEPEINLTALIDVVFLLLIFFMVSTTFDQTHHFDVSLPRSDSSPVTDRVRGSSVVLMLDGQVRIGEWSGRLDDQPALQAKLRQTFSSQGGEPVVVYADEEISHGQVVILMSAMAEAGVESVQVATRYNQR